MQKPFHSIITPKKLYLAGAGFIVIFSLFPVWYNSIREPFPIGYAGMYAQLAEQIADENLKLPINIDYYGSGGVPAAFPPFGMYLLAINLKMGGPLWSYLRFVPSLFATLAIPALFLLVQHVTKSKTTGALAVLLASSSPYLHTTHVWAAGIVRGLAFVFGLFFLYLFIRNKEHSSRKEMVLAGILFGLVVLTHLSYAFFIVLWSLIFVIVNFRKDLFLRAFSIGAIGTLLSLPWVLFIIYRHGIQVFISALGSHGTLSIFNNSDNLVAFYDILSISVSEIVNQPILAALAVIGLVFSFSQKRWFLVSASFITVLFSFESRRFMVILACIFAGIAIESITSWSTNVIEQPKRHIATLITYSASGIILAVSYINGMQPILKETSSLSPATLEVAVYLQSNSTEESHYVILADHHEAEWFPFLAKRTPLFAFWGSEWKGDLESLRSGLYTSMDCGKNGDIHCLNQIIQISGETPRFLVVMKRRYRGLIDVLKTQPEWSLIYNNSEYQIWKNLQ